jgi:hypothetical protein
MKQTKLMSLVESFINIAVGLGVAMTFNAIILPRFGFHITLSQNAIFAAIMTVVSLARSFLLRRLFEALHIRIPISPFMSAVIAERRRQIDVEGWTHEHDDRAHYDGDMALAGAFYARYAGDKGPAPGGWPWADEWWKPAGFRRDLVKGCALIVAEGEKFDRNKRCKPKLVQGGYTAPEGGKKPALPTTGSGVQP